MGYNLIIGKQSASYIMSDSIFCCTQTNKKKQFVYARIVNRSGCTLSVGVNSYVKTKPLQAKWAKKCNLPLKQHVHAEVAAIAKLSPEQRKKAYAIYVYRFDRSGRPALAKPCKICQALIREIGIKHVYYTTDENDLNMSYPRYTKYKAKYASVWCDEDYM